MIILETKGILEAGQAGFRAFYSTDSNMCMYTLWPSLGRFPAARLPNKTHPQYKACVNSFGSHRLPNNVRSTFFGQTSIGRIAYNSMSRLALSAMMRRLHIPDVDLLEQLYEFATVLLASKNCRAATIRFQTGVAQGSSLSPTRFLIFGNTLARLLAEMGKSENIGHGMDGVPGFNRIFFTVFSSVRGE